MSTFGPDAFGYLVEPAVEPRRDRRLRVIVLGTALSQCAIVLAALALAAASGHHRPTAGGAPAGGSGLSYLCPLR